MAKKILGRVGVSFSDSASGFRAYHIRVVVQDPKGWSPVKLSFTAQSSPGDHDRAYALQLSSVLRLSSYSIDDDLAMIRKLYKAMQKESAPRAVLSTDGKAYLDNCEVARFLQGCEKLGLHVSRFSTVELARDWADNRKEVLDVPAITEAVTA
jgi:hypothetical protein